MPVVVRNNTNSVLTDIQLTATVRDPGGVLIAAGGSQGLHPGVVQPGGISLGFVYFEVGVKVPTDANIEVNATGSDFDPSAPFGAVDLEVLEVNAASGQIVGVLKNSMSFDVEGPISVGGVCFDVHGSLLADFSGYADVVSLAAGVSAPFTVDLYGKECPSFLLGASGYSF